MSTFGHGRGVGLGLLITGVVCPCHVLVGGFSLLTGGSLLSPAAQDGLHAVYVPLAVLAGAALLGKPRATPDLRFAKLRGLTFQWRLRQKELPEGQANLRGRSH